MARYRRTTLVTTGCLASLIGVGAARLFDWPRTAWPLACLLAIPFLLRRNYLSLLAVITIGLGLGIYRGSVFVNHWHDLANLNNQKVSLTVRATQDAVYGNNGQLDFNASSAQLSNSQKLTGSFKISGFGPAMVYRGDRLSMRGKLHLSHGSSQASLSYATITKLSADESVINHLTRRLSAGMQTALPEPNSSFGLGLLVGQRNTLPNELYQQLIMVGLVHIVAVSGYNLTILVRAASRLRLFSKYQQLVLSLLLIATFLLMTGFAASIVRAAIVSVLSLWAWYYGRRLRPIVSLAFAAALTGLANPFYVWGDPSWYLSFLAFAGILLIAPILSARLFRRPPKLLLATALETFCAELMALPIIMLMFGQLSLIGLIANVLVVPLVPLAMMLSAIAALAGAVVPGIAGWLAAPANWLLTYMLDLVRWFASWPGIFQKRSISLAGLLIFYAVIGGSVLIFNYRHSPKNTSKPL